MKSIVPYISLGLLLFLFIACEESIVEDNGSQEPNTETPVQKDTLKPGKQVKVTSTDFSLGNGIDDPYDSLFINFDGKIIESTTPHYEWTIYDGYYYPENRVILNDTTLVLIFDGHQADSFGQENDYSFTVTSEDGTVCPVRISIPFFHHYFDIEEEGIEFDYFSFYNDYSEILYLSNRKLTRIDYSTGQVIRKYDLSSLPEELNKFRVNPYNGFIYLWYVNPTGFGSTNIYALDLESGEVWLALSVPEDETVIYQFIEPVELAFTKYGTGLLLLHCYESSNSRMKIVRTSNDGTLRIEDPTHYPDEDELGYSMIATFINYLVPGWDGTFLYCVSEHALDYYIIFDGDQCNMSYGPLAYDHKLYVIPNKLNGSVFMRELYHQFLVSADGVTGPFSYLDSRMKEERIFAILQVMRTWS